MAKIVVIGAGIGGLSIAALLAKQRHQVTLLEKNKSVGGRARRFIHKGFSFDMGPSWYMMPDVFENFFAVFGKKVSDYYQLEKLEPSYRIFFRDHHIDMVADKKKAMQLFARLEKDGDNKLEAFLGLAKKQYDISMEHFTYKPFQSFTELFELDAIKNSRNLVLLKSFEQLTKKYFSSQKARQIIQYSIVFLGGSPANTPGIFSMINHADINQGIWYPKGGIYSIILALESLCNEQGVQIKTEQEVTHITTKKGQAKAVKTHNKTYHADLVVANADYAHVETNLLDPESRSYSASYWNKRTIAPSAFIMYLGIKKKIIHLEHHNLFFMHDWKKHFHDIFKHPSWPKKPSFYVCCPSKTDDSVAPAGYENIFITVPLSTKVDDTPLVRKTYGQKILQLLEQVTKTQITADDIEALKTFCIKDFKQDYNAYQGTALGLSHTLLQSAFLRPRHRSKKMDNLYYTGQYCHPGIGMATVLISSMITADMIKKSVKTQS